MDDDSDSRFWNVLGKFFGQKSVSIEDLILEARADGSLIDASFAISPLTSNTVTNRVNPVPAAGAPAAQTTFLTPNDSFFSYAKYRGAFEPGGENWIPSYSVAADIGSDLSAVAGCTGDLNRDGIVNATDFGLFVNAFNNTCY